MSKFNKKPAFFFSNVFQKIVEDVTTNESEINIPWNPTPAQKMLIESQADYIFYGGRAGAGKTYALVYSAIKHFKAIIFRREYPQLRGIIELSLKLFGQFYSYNRTEKTWNLGNRQLEFGAVQYEHDVQKYQGREHSLKGFDEITHFSYEQFIYLSGWNRSPDSNVKCQIIATGNPPTSLLGLWVIKFWSPWLDKNYEVKTGRKKASPGELRWFVVHEGNDIEVESSEAVKVTNKDGTEETLIPKSRTFIPGQMVPELEKSGYKATLQQLPVALRKALLDGSFDIEIEDDAFQVLPIAWVEAAMARWVEPKLLNPTHVGCDVGRGGDTSGYAVRYQNQIGSVTEYQTKDSEEFYQILVRELIKNPPTNKVSVQVDQTGVGAAVIDILKQKKKNNWRVVPLNSAGSTVSKNNERMTDKSGLLDFFNLRAFWWWNLRNLLDPELGDSRGYVITLPPNEKLKEELCSIRYEETPSGKIKIESKDTIKKTDRLGRSPNLADSVVYAFAISPDENSSEKWRRFIEPGKASKLTYYSNNWR